MTPQLYTAEEIADLLKVDLTVINAHLAAKRLQGINVGIETPIWRFLDEDITAFIDGLRKHDSSQALVLAEKFKALPGVYRLNIKTDAKPGFDPRAYCLKEGIAGVGWAIPTHQLGVTWDEYRRGAATQYGDNLSWQTVIALHDLPIGAVIWTRTGYGRDHTRFFAGLMVGPWEYRNTPEGEGADVVNIRPVRWHEAGGYSVVPEAIVNAFTPGTLAPIKNPAGIRFTQGLAAQLIASGEWPDLV